MEWKYIVVGAILGVVVAYFRTSMAAQKTSGTTQPFGTNRAGGGGYGG